MIRCIAGLADRILGWFAPPIELLDVLGPNDLADIEADLEVHEPLAPWKQELHDAFHMTDEQWAARQRFLATPSVSEGSPLHGEKAASMPPVDVVWPAGTASATECAGGPSPSDEVLIEELVADYRDFLRGLFKRG